MKKIVCFLLAVLLSAAFLGCEKPNAHDAQIREAIEEIKDSWEELYDDNGIDSDYLEIKNTRILFLEEDAFEIWDAFEDVACIIEFELFSEYYGPDAYPINVKYMDSVLVYEDGDMEVIGISLLRTYISATYRTDFSDIIDSIEDYGSRYNQILDVDE